MKIETRTVLKAEEGMTLTNGETFGKAVYLGNNDRAENWREITDEEAKQRQEEQIEHTEE